MFGNIDKEWETDCSVSGSNCNNVFDFYKMLDLSQDSKSRHVLEVWILSVIGAILVGLSGIFPLLVIPLESGAALKHGEPAKKLRLMLSFAVGSLLGDVFLHLLPEVWAHMGNDHESHTRVGLWVITGLLAFMIVEKMMGDDNDDKEKSQDECIRSDSVKPLSSTISPHCAEELTKQIQQTTHSVNHRLKNGNDETNTSIKRRQSVQEDSSKTKIEPQTKIKISGYLNLVANVVDNFTHGLAVAASFCISTKVGIATTVAILLHEIPHEVGDFAILLRSGFDRWRAAKAQFLTASGGVIGAITALTAESVHVAGERTAWILPFTSGGFMYIALVTVVPDLLKEKLAWESLKQVVCICLGVLSMLLVTILFET